MDKEDYLSPYGEIFQTDEEPDIERQETYLIVKSGQELICAYDDETGLYSFPSQDDVDIDLDPTLEFSVTAYIQDDDNLIKETQTYRVFEVDNAQLDDLPLYWCSVEQILIGDVPLTAHQKIGFKNLYVRVVW